MTTTKLTQKRQEEIYRNAMKRLRGMQPPSIASRMYPKLKSEIADDQPRQGLFQGWAHLNLKRSQQKEK